MLHPGKPFIALVQGETCGIGPELTARLLAEESVRRSAGILVFSDRWVFEAGYDVAAVHIEVEGASSLDEVNLDAHPLTVLDSPGVDPVTTSSEQVSAAALAAFTPHAGDGGAIGREEIEIIGPAGYPNGGGNGPAS